MFIKFYASAANIQKMSEIKNFLTKKIYLLGKLVFIMKRNSNFNLDEAIKRALRESIEAHAREWEPDFKTGVGPVGDDAPFDNKVSGDMNEGEIPADARDWEPDFKTGVGEVGDDSPFTKAVGELNETEDWEKDSFGAEEPKKEGIAYADGAEECGNGVVATSQKNSGEVVSQDNLSEGKDEKEDEGFFRNVGQGIKAAVKPAVDRFKNAYKDGKAQDAAMKSAKAYAGDRNNYEKDANGQWQLKAQNQGNAQPAQEEPAAQQMQNTSETAMPQQGQENNSAQGQANNVGGNVSKAELKQWMENHANEQDKNGAWENLWQFVANGQPLQESKVEEKDVIAEERDRFFNIMNRIEKLYD